MQRRLLALLLPWIWAPSVLGDTPVSETGLKLRGPRGESLRGSFLVTYPLAKPPTYERHDLQEERRGTVLPLTGVTITTTREPGAGDPVTDVVTVTVAAPAAAGHFVGRLEVKAVDGTPARPIAIDATFEATPAVEPEANSKSARLRLTGTSPLQRCWRALLGRAPAQGSERLAGTLYLVQSAEADYTVTAPVIGVLQGPRGPLPGGTVTAELSCTRGGPYGATEVRLKARGGDLHADQYDGSLLMRVPGQAGAIQIPVTVLVKDGALLALVVLVLGLATAALLQWWNGGQRALHDTAVAARRLRDLVDRDGRLQQEERERCAARVAAVLQAIGAGADASEVAALWEVAQKEVQGQRQAAAALVERLREVGWAVARLEAATRLQAPLKESNLALQSEVLAGRYPRLAAAEDRVAALEVEVAATATVLTQFQALPPAEREKKASAVAGAATLAELRTAVGAAGGAGDEAVVPDKAAPGWRFPREQILRLAAAAVLILVYGLVLAVGWITLYVKSATFGADPMDYVSLFLWGATIETVRGQTVTFASLRAATQR